MSHPTSPEEARLQPPFPPAGTYPDARSPPPSHPGAEAMVNAAAQHAVPTQPAPTSPQGKPKEVTHEGRTDVDLAKSHSRHREAESAGCESGGEEEKEEEEEREEQPLVGGTPLEEMTPVVEKGGKGAFPFARQASRLGQSNILPRGPGAGDDDEVGLDASPQEGGRSAGGRVTRPGFGAAHEMGSVRVGASALFSALNALPWEENEDSSSENDDSDEGPSARHGQMGKSEFQPRPRPKVTRMHSSLHTIRPMSESLTEDAEIINVPSTQQQHANNLHFPFRQNTIARKARSPGVNELSYQFAAGEQLAQPGLPTLNETRRSSGESSLSLGPDAQALLNERTAKEEHIGEEEEEEEIMHSLPEQQQVALEPIISGHGDEPSDFNTDAALREGDGREAVVEKMMDRDPAERHRKRKERLAEKLKDVFGLEEREEVLEEMRCWLLRSVMLKGYMYLTPKRICFFAHMPGKENHTVKTGPLNKKASRTKMNTKYWVVLKNDVLSWYESTADPYFPKGNVSLQYASSCDAVDETRFKLRLPERNYTFSADSESTRDEWVKAIQKVMFKTQHEGDSVKLIIPLDAVLEIEKAPTLEFAETIEVRCVDPEDNMSVDSYFFASFQDDERALSSIQNLLDSRPPSSLPRLESYQSSENVPLEPRKSSDSDTTVVSGVTGGLKKLTSVLKPLIHKSDDKADSEAVTKDTGSSIFRLRSNPSHDSLETLRTEETSENDGYPPRQSGKPPAGHEDGKTWTPSWIAKPASKILGRSPLKASSSKSSLTTKSMKSPRSRRLSDDHARSYPRTRGGRGKQSSVTEVVEREDPSSDDESDDESRRFQNNRPRMSFGSVGSGSSENPSSFSLMEKSQTGQEEDDETANKFRSVFSLGESEELIDHFPGYLYRVLPVSGRFFVSTNYFCFRSSQLLYKTKMIIPIQDLYGMKAQKAFRFGHSGLIIVIKGHEELFLEFSSSRRRKACISLLEERMEQVRQKREHGVPDADKIQTRIMEDLDESSPVETRATSVAPSHMFGSTISTFLDFKPEPMKITCLTIGSRGDVQPYIALCKGLQAEGHTTKIASHGEYKDWVEGHGIEFASVGGDPAELMQMCVDNGMFTVSFLKEGLQKFRGWLDDLLNSSWEACQGSELLIESPSAMGGIHIAEGLGIPYYRAFTMPWTRTRAYPHAFAVPEHKRGGSYNYMTYTMFDQVFWRAISGQVNRWRKNVLKIESTTFDKLEQHKVPFLYNFSPNVVPPPLDWTEWIHVTGYWFLENADESAKKDKWQPPEGLLDFIDGAHSQGKKVVYIGFGSIVVSDPQEMTRCVVDAVVDSGVCAILSKGWSDRGSKAKGEEGDSGGADGIEYPPEIFAIESIDHSWLFPRIDAACHHGGAGTSGASLRAGIPTIIKPFFGDQAFWSERVESLNVGSAVRKLTAEALAEALRKATTDEKQIAKAKVVGELIRKENGVARAIEAIYRDLEYAKSIVKPRSSPPERTLDKIPSILNPLSHTDSLKLTRSKSKSSRRDSDASASPDSRRASRSSVEGTASAHEQEHASDESWDVVSESEEGKVKSSFGSLLGSPVR